jgi:hypothetical protein
MQENKMLRLRRMELEIPQTLAAAALQIPRPRLSLFERHAYPLPAGILERYRTLLGTTSTAPQQKQEETKCP